MLQEFKNRVFGAIVLKSINSNFNADFTHHPRTLPDGVVYSTDKALKYCVKDYIKKNYQAENMFYVKRFNDKLNPLSLDDTYVHLFKKFPKKSIDKFSLFYFDGENVKGILPDKPKKKEIVDYFKALENNSSLKVYSKFFEELSVVKEMTYKKEIEVTKPTEDGEFYFYLDKNNLVKKIEGDQNELEEICKKLDELLTGGIDRNEVLRNLLTCLDIRLFGATFAGATNISIHGTTQINHGINRFSQNDIYSEAILSPFRNPGEKGSDEKAMSTIGNQTNLKEGHYVFHFSVNPKNTKEFYLLINKDKTDDQKLFLSGEDINKLKEAFNNAVTALDSSRKIGTENEATLWIQLIEGSKKMLPSFTELISINENREIDFTRAEEVINSISDEIEQIEVYFNPTTTVIKGMNKSKKVKHINILNNQEM
ncbi:MAG: type I CRISPR-associated protein Cas7 [Ignavibacteria bacterium]|nr:type I CRISPR-associated protein Cas7 [Ignavibacteria bacterium]